MWFATRSARRILPRFRAANIVARGTDSICGFFSKKTFDMHFTVARLTENGSNMTSYHRQLGLLKHTLKSINCKINEKLIADTTTTAIVASGTMCLGLISCVDSNGVVFIISRLLFVLSGMAIPIYVIPELTNTLITKARIWRQVRLLKDYYPPKDLTDLEKENVKINQMYYFKSCMGFWNTAAPIINAVAAGIHAAHALSGNSNTPVYDYGAAYINYRFASEGMSDWNDQAMSIDKLDRHRMLIANKLDREINND